MIWLSGPLRQVDTLKGNARNDIFSIRIKRGVPYPAAIALQERWEQGLQRAFVLLVFLPVMIGAAALAYAVPNGVIALLVAPFLLLLPLIPFRSWVELRGHAIEIAAAVQEYGANLDQYEAAEANMFYGYGGIFKRYGSVEGVQAELRKLRPWAAEIARRHAQQIRKDKEKLG